MDRIEVQVQRKDGCWQTYDHTKSAPRHQDSDGATQVAVPRQKGKGYR
jgi:hypothetical protein